MDEPVMLAGADQDGPISPALGVLQQSTNYIKVHISENNFLKFIIWQYWYATTVTVYLGYDYETPCT